MRPLVLILAASVSAGTAMQVHGQAAPCTNTGSSSVKCLPPAAQDNVAAGAYEVSGQNGDSGSNPLVPPQLSPQQLADSAVGHAISANPQKDGENQIDYTIRVTRIARESVVQRSPQAATILLNRLEELEDMKQRMKPQ
jgi:hypothetical protein